MEQWNYASLKRVVKNYLSFDFREFIALVIESRGINTNNPFYKI
jgi:hypothetical protein